MHITLIYPPVIRPSYKFHMTPPCGIGTLAGFLRNNSFHVDLRDMNVLLKKPSLLMQNPQDLGRDLYAFFNRQLSAGRYTGITGDDDDALAERLVELSSIAKDTALIGISVCSECQILTALLLAEKIKKRDKRPIVLGGPYVTHYASLFLNQHNFIDYAVIGDGEIPLLKLLHSIGGEETLENVPSLCYRDKSQWVFNKIKTHDLENQTCADYDGLPLEIYRTYRNDKRLIIPYNLSRGCTNNCKFCTRPNFEGQWQLKSVKKAVAEISLLSKKYHTDSFLFTDANFNISIKYVEDFCDALIAENLGLLWFANCQLRNMDRESINRMKKAGCKTIFWGIESGSEKILNRMDKALDLGQALNLLKASKEAGITNLLYLMIGYPYEEVEDLRKTALFLKDNANFIDGSVVNNFRLFYASPIFDDQKKERIKIKENPLSFITYCYDFQEIDREETVELKKSLQRGKAEIFRIILKYIFPKNRRFPLNVFLRLFGPELLGFLSYLISKERLKKLLGKALFDKNLEVEFDYIVQYLSHLRGI
jgi:anaerobic magnesium-protoporphyrin IX monomethyl ester cyclase